MPEPPQGIAVPPETTHPWWRSEACFRAGLVLAVALCAWTMARYDLMARARHAYLEGRRYEDWYRNPALKKAHLDAELASGRIGPERYALLMSDSDLKNAYVWYDTAVTLYRPPDDVWVRRCEDGLRRVKPLYDAWLKGLGVVPAD